MKNLTYKAGANKRFSCAFAIGAERGEFSRRAPQVRGAD